MAVYDDYVDTQILAGRTTGAITGQGANLVVLKAAFDTVAAHDAGSIYRVFKSIPSSAVPIMLGVATDGVTGMNDVDIGLYKVGAGGAAVSAEALKSTLDLSSAVTLGTAMTGMGNGLGNLDSNTYGKSLWELAGETLSSRQFAYDIGLKSVADLSEADRICVVAFFAFP